MEIDTDFEKVRKYQRESSARRYPDVIETVEQYPNSQKDLVECTSWGDCDYTGTVIRYNGHNTYYRCPECGDDSMVVVG